MSIGGNLKLLRNRNNLSQERVSTDIDLYRSTYSGYENGVAQPSIELLIKFSEYYRLSIDLLLKEDFEKY